MTPLSRLTLAAANSCRTISSSPWQSATLGENGRRSAKPANLGSEPKKVTNPPKIPNEPSNSLKTHESTGFVFSFPTPDRRALPHQPPNLVHFLVRHRDSPLRPVALHPYPVPQAVDHDVPAGVPPPARAPRPPHPGTKYAAANGTCSTPSAGRRCTAPPAPASARSVPPATRSPHATPPFRTFFLPTITKLSPGNPGHPHESNNLHDT